MALASPSSPPVPRRRDHRIILHFDYDCFYAAVFEAENPALKSLPLAVQQKHIIVTCNYEARRRGLRKLQLINEARKQCPDLVVVVGEELGRFRDASKANCKLFEAVSWSGKVERLGFDEVFMDVTDMIEYNQNLLNPNSLTQSFFQLVRSDPTAGFSFDATSIAGNVWPRNQANAAGSRTPEGPLHSVRDPTNLSVRLGLGSHLAQHLRHKLDEERGYTSTVGISTSKLLSKLVGNLNKPRGQTTLLPPYEAPSAWAQAQNDASSTTAPSNVTAFIDSHEVGKIPGIGFKMSHRLQDYILGSPAEPEDWHVYVDGKGKLQVAQLRLHQGMGPELLERVLAGPGMEKGVGSKVWTLLNGVDDTQVKQIREVPSQISIEDSYLKLDSIQQVTRELRKLSISLIKRMRADLGSTECEVLDPKETMSWSAFPKTLRLSIRPRLLTGHDDSRSRSVKRISRSAPLPRYVCNMREEPEVIADKLVTETLLLMFRRLNPDKQGWSMSLINVAVTNIVQIADAAGGDGGGGRDISFMFKNQDSVLREWNVADVDMPPDSPSLDQPLRGRKLVEFHNIFDVGDGSESSARDYPPHITGNIGVTETVESNESSAGQSKTSSFAQCELCGISMPIFASAAHLRYHTLGND